MKRQTQILRDTAILSNPHTLSRPQRTYENQFVSKAMLANPANELTLGIDVGQKLSSNVLANEAQVKPKLDPYQEGFLAGQVEASAKSKAETIALMEAKFAQELQTQIEAQLKVRVEQAIETEVEQRIAARIADRMEAEFSARYHSQIESEVKQRVTHLFQSELENSLERELSQVRAAAQQSAYDEGLQQARAQAEDELKLEIQTLTQNTHRSLNAKIEALEKIALQLPATTAYKLAEIEDDMVALCFASICKVVGENLVSAEGLTALVAHQVQEFVSAPVQVHVHPDDWRMIEEQRMMDEANQSRSMTHLGLSERVTWIADSRVVLGGAVIRSSEASLDARLETQLAALKSALIRARKENMKQVQLDKNSANAALMTSTGA